MAEQKFKVGDRVKVVNCLLSPRLVGSYATICNVFYESVAKERHIYKLKNLSKFKNITPYYWFDEKDLEFASTKKEEAFSKEKYKLDFETEKHRGFEFIHLIVNEEKHFIGTYDLKSKTRLIYTGDVNKKYNDTKFNDLLRQKIIDRFERIEPEQKTIPTPYEPYTPNKTIVSHEIIGNTTYVTLSNGDKGMARCNPKDKFDAYTGLKLATERAYGITEAEEPKPKRKLEVGKKYIIMDLLWRSGNIIQITDCVNTKYGLRYTFEVIKGEPYPCDHFYETSYIERSLKPYEEPKVKEVKRKAKVGEYIKLIKKDYYFNEVGDILKVTSMGKICVCVSTDNQPRKDEIVYPCIGWYYSTNEYVVLENYKPEDETQEIKEVRRVAKVGEYIKIVNPIFSFGKYKNGDILNVIVSNPTTVIAKDIPIQIRHEEYVVLENYKPEGNEKLKLKFKEGDCVFVRNATIGCQGANGYRGKVTNLEATNGLLKYCVLDTTNVRLENGGVWRVNTDGLEFAKSNL